ncbi:MAG: hypothetical protein NZ739_05780, partial [Verrucomicrobiae bacterium]|nr:hypothetical protein [Verrucomicrobiae bacterium]
MESSDNLQGQLPAPQRVAPRTRVFAVGKAGIAAAIQLLERGVDPQTVVTLCRDGAATQHITGAKPIIVPTAAPTQASAGKITPELLAEIKAQLDGADFVFVVGALGGQTGREFIPRIARVAKESGNLVFGFVSLPFDCEGSLRQTRACAAMQALKSCTDAVLCVPNQKLWKLIPENAPLEEAFKISDSFLADAMHGMLRMLTCKSVIEVHLPELCMVLGGPNNQTAFAVAEASGPNRARKAVEKLLASPTLDAGIALRQADAIVVGVFSGPDLAISEVHSVIEQLSRHCPNVPVITGAGVDASLGAKLVATLFVGRAMAGSGSTPTSQTAQIISEVPLRTPSQASGPDTHPGHAATASRPPARVVPPPPELPEEKITELLERQTHKTTLPKPPARWRQEQLKLELVSKGRFDKSEPTIYKGEDLD